MIDTLLISGCSFTFEPHCWPNHVAKELSLDEINVGMGSAGNGLIAKRLMSTCERLLKEKKPEEILVGIMWSGTDRHHKYTDHKIDSSVYLEDGSLDERVQNPTWAGNPEHLHWIMMNPWHLQTSHSEKYYLEYHTDIHGQTTTLEYILLTQLYLKSKGIKYFMTTFKNIFSEDWNFDKNNLEVKYLYDQIDFSKFAPIDGCMEWVTEHYPEKGFPQRWDDHPNEFGYKKFAEEVLVPFINSL